LQERIGCGQLDTSRYCCDTHQWKNDRVGRGDLEVFLGI